MLPAQAGLFADVFKTKVAAVEVKPVGLHIAAKEKVGQAVVVHVADGYAAAVVKIAEKVAVEGVRVGHIVVKATPVRSAGSRAKLAAWLSGNP